MSRENDVIEKATSRAYRDASRARRDGSLEYAFMSELQNVNEPVECVLLLGRLNEAIELLSCLQDSHYTEYIWNSSVSHSNDLQEAGLTDDLFYNMELKLAKLRQILMGDNLNWDEVYQNLYLSVLGHEVYWRKFYEERADKLDYELKKAKRESEDK